MTTRLLSKILSLTLVSIKTAREIDGNGDCEKKKISVSIEIYEHQKDALFWLSKHHKEGGISPYMRKLGIPKLLKIEEQEVSP